MKHLHCVPIDLKSASSNLYTLSYADGYLSLCCVCGIKSKSQNSKHEANELFITWLAVSYRTILMHIFMSTKTYKSEKKVRKMRNKKGKVIDCDLIFILSNAYWFDWFFFDLLVHDGLLIILLLQETAFFSWKSYQLRPSPCNPIISTHFPSFLFIFHLVIIRIHYQQ